MSYVKRTTDALVWRLRELADKLVSGDALVTAFSESRMNRERWEVLPQVTIKAEGAIGTLEYTVAMPVHIRHPDGHNDRWTTADINAVAALKAEVARLQAQLFEAREQRDEARTEVKELRAETDEHLRNRLNMVPMTRYLDFKKTQTAQGVELDALAAKYGLVRGPATQPPASFFVQGSAQCFNEHGDPELVSDILMRVQKAEAAERTMRLEAAHALTERDELQAKLEKLVGGGSPADNEVLLSLARHINRVCFKS
jgi:hypothetical protein